MRRDNKTKKPISIRWKLASHLVTQTIIVLLVTWIMQVYLLDNFYELTKRRELQSCANILSQNIDDKDLTDVASDLAIDCAIRVSVYRESETENTLLVDVDATGGMAMYITPEKVVDLAARARQNGGVYIGKIAFGGYELHDDFFNFGLPNQWGEYEQLKSDNTRLVCVMLTENNAGTPCCIVLDSALLPLDSTVQTLKYQFIWIASFLLIIACISVFMLYRYISKPLIQMTESAKQLAKGKYDTNFVGKNYRETHELADTLNYAATELSRADHLQKELLANISHDLRTPLTMIKGYSELMRDIPGENTPENMQVVIDETQRLSELVTDLLDLSMMQSQTTSLNKMPFNLTDAIRVSMTRYDALIRHRGYRIDFIADNDVYISADHKMILQVLYNLINNAINYTGEDHVVTVTQLVSNDRVRISISDTGEGIAPEDMPMIWDRYYKVDKVHKRAMVGTGLGLSIVKEILEKHDAVYGVSSVRGQGSTFWFEFPVLPVNEEQADISEQSEE